MAFTRYTDSDIVVSTNKLVTSTWTNNTNNLRINQTSSLLTSFSSATSSGQFFINVYNLEPDTNDTAEVQYALAYGNKLGSGSPDFTNDTGSFGLGASRTIYNQYRQLVFGDENQNFSFPGDGSTNAYSPDDIYVININRSRYKNNLKTSTLNLTLASGSTKLHLTDDSVTSTGSAQITNAGRQFNIVSGSSGTRLGSSTIQVTNSGSYGLYYPDSGFIVLNPAALDHHLVGPSFPTSSQYWGALTPNTTANTAANNHQKLLNAIHSGSSFTVDSEEKISSKYYFTRIKNFEFNFTSNPSFIDSSGNLRYGSMESNPKVYITTVGLYNDNNELLAVAKLSQPIAKDFSKEALIRVKLDY